MKQKLKLAKNRDLCSDCEGLCCKYIAFPLDNPQSRKDYDDIRWYLCHEGVSVFLEEGQWYVSVANGCKYLCKETKKCLIYENRPEICKNFEADGCEFRSTEYGYDLHFTTDKQMQEYIKIKFDNNKIPKRKKKELKSSH